MGNIQTLTGLRGFAAFVVFISHSANQGLFPNVFGDGLGQLGVMIFFVLSGFLMGYLYLDKPFTSESFKNYAVARVARVLPLYFSLLLLSFVVSNYLYSDFHYNFQDTNQLIKSVVLYSAPYEFWTIPVEFQFYVIFVVFWYLTGRKLGIPFLAVTVIVGLFVSIWYFQKNHVFLFFVNSYLVPFVVGLLLSRKSFLSKAKNNTPLAIIALIAMFTINLPSVRLEQGWVLSDNFFIRTWVDPLNWLVVFSIFYFSVIESPAYRFLNHSLFTKLGEISFGFYLFHYPILKLTKLLPTPTLLNFVLAFCFVWLLAYLSFNYFEKPIANGLKKFSNKPRSGLLKSY